MMKTFFKKVKFLRPLELVPPCNLVQKVEKQNNKLINKIKVFNLLNAPPPPTVWRPL